MATQSLTVFDKILSDLLITVLVLLKEILPTKSSA